MLIFKDGKVADYKEMFNSTSFPSSGPSEQFLTDKGAVRVSTFKPHNRRIEKLVSVEPYVEDGWAYTVMVEPKTQEEIEADVASQASKIRSQRNKLLESTDWVVIMNAEKNTNIPENWAIYRQALRDITKQSGFPYDVTWPTKPE